MPWLLATDPDIMHCFQHVQPKFILQHEILLSDVILWVNIVTVHTNMI